MWPFRKPLPDRIARNLNIIVKELRDLQAWTEQPGELGELKRRIQHMAYTVARVLPRLYRDVDTFLDEIQAVQGLYRIKDADNFSIFEVTHVRLIMDALTRLREPVKQYLELMANYADRPTSPYSKDSSEELLEARLRLFLSIAEKMSDAR